MRKLGNALMNFFRKGDLLLLFLCVLASVYGMVVIASATHYMGGSRHVVTQGVALLIGIVVYVIFSLIDVEYLTEHRSLLLLFMVVLLLMLIPWGKADNTGNRAWLHFKLIPFNIQPAEICKISFILLLAKTMSLHQDRISSLRNVGSITGFLLLICGLIVVISKDAGSALVFVFIFLVIAGVGGIRGWWFLGAAGVVAVSAPTVWKYFVQDHQKQRILMLFDPSIDPTGQGVRWDTNRSMTMLSGGGVAGQGLFHGAMTQDGSISAQHTDFIFAAIGEELGLLGCAFTILLITAIIARCIHTGLKTSSLMNRLICFGIAAMLIFQLLVNVGMCIGVFPVIGLTLPFISYGGSSLITLFMAMGIVSSVHMRPNPEAASPYVQPRY